MVPGLFQGGSGVRGGPVYFASGDLITQIGQWGRGEGGGGSLRERMRRVRYAMVPPARRPLTSKKTHPTPVSIPVATGPRMRLCCTQPSRSAIGSDPCILPPPIYSSSSAKQESVRHHPQTLRIAVLQTDTLGVDLP